MTHVGIFNEYYFQNTDTMNGVEETELMNFYPQYGVSQNPITQEREYYIGLGFTSKYDGDGIKKYGRVPTKLIIVLDISGSMEGYMKIVKNTLLNMLNRLGQNDYLGIILFDDVADILLEMQKWSELEKERDKLEYRI